MKFLINNFLVLCKEKIWNKNEFLNTMNEQHPKIWCIEHMIFMSRIRYWFAEDELKMQTI